MKRDATDWPSLQLAAREALRFSYSPYSRYPVAAALRSADGRVFTGVNVENASYGLTLCAERSAIVAAVAAGAREFTALVIVVPGATPASPCGACRQVLREFPPSFAVRSYGSRGRPLTTTTAALLPASFGPENLAPPKRRKPRT
jgi:cytidine deaminase